MIAQREVVKDCVCCDVTDEIMYEVGEPASGWAIVRLHDGLEVAHFGALDMIAEGVNGHKLFSAGMGVLNRISARLEEEVDA